MQSDDLLYGTTAILTSSITILKPKRKYPLRKVSASKSSIQLTSLQKEVLIGTLLGDAHLERVKHSHNVRLRFDQTFPGHASYLMLFYGIFHNLTSKIPQVHIRKPDKRTGNVYYSLAFKTVTLPCLNALHTIFYQNGTNRA